MKTWFIAALAFLIVIAASAAELKPRVIVLTDLKRFHETDDSQSLIRLLAHADLVEIEAIIVSSGMNYWQPEHAIDGYAYGFELLEAYARDVTNLMKLRAQRGFEPVEARQPVGYWPSPSYLVQRYALGTPLQGLERVGAGKDNDGSRLITAIVDEPDERPVYVLAWGGPNVLAQTLWDLTENPQRRRTPEAVAEFVRRLRVVAIGDQDVPWNRRQKPDQSRNASHWLRRTFPALHWVYVSGSDFARVSRDRQPFYQAHVQGHGALGSAYPDHSNGVEGDSPSLFHVLPLGLGDPAHPEWGTLAGVFVRGTHRLSGDTMFLADPVEHAETRAVADAFSARTTVPMWNSLAARLDWARSGTGNRPPSLVVDGDATPAVLVREVAVGETVTLDASATRDGEQDKLTFAWELLPVPGAFNGPLELGGAQTPKLSLTIPPAAAHQDLHLLLAVTDDGAGHPLTAWKRVLVRVRP